VTVLWMWMPKKNKKRKKVTKRKKNVPVTVMRDVGGLEPCNSLLLPRYAPNLLQIHCPVGSYRRRLRTHWIVSLIAGAGVPVSMSSTVVAQSGAECCRFPSIIRL
jgi:hypothetical protein